MKKIALLLILPISLGIFSISNARTAEEDDQFCLDRYNYCKQNFPADYNCCSWACRHWKCPK